MKKIICMILFVMMSLSLTACTGCKQQQNSEEPNNDYVLNVEESLTLNIYDEGRKIEVESNNPSEAVTFSTDSDVITVLSDGTIVANKFGTATVTVTCGSEVKTCTVTVLETDAIPVISLYGITGSEIDLIAGDSFALDYSASIEGHLVDATYSFKSSNTGIFTVDAEGVLSAVSQGNAYLTITYSYKLWEVEQIYDVAVTTGTVVKLSQNKLTLCPIEGIEGNQTSKRIEFLGVFEEGVAVNGATVTWQSMDEEVATVEDGVITAVGLGKTYVKAVYDNGVKSVYSYVLVTVAYPVLQAPANFRLEDDTLVWDSVVAADGYTVFDGTYEVKTSGTSLKLSELNPNNNYFSAQNFYVSAFSNTEGVMESKMAVCSSEFETLSFTDRIVKPQDTYEAQIKEYTGTDFVADVPIYHATCTGTAIPGKPEIYGYLFRKVYYTQKAADIYGVNGSHGNWCNTSLLNPAKVSNFYDSKITFWAYAEKETTIYYIKMNQTWDRTIISKQTIPEDSWTNVAFSISQNDFPYLTMLTSTSDFYFTDFRISTLTYMSKDYSDIDKSVERVENVVSMINELPEVAQAPNTMEFGDALKAIRDEYELLSDRRKSAVTNYEKLVAVEEAFGLSVYDEVKSDEAITALITKLDEYNTSFNGVSMDNFNGFETKAAAITEAINALNSKQYYGVTYANTNYATYMQTRKAYKLIDITTSNVKDIIGSSSAITATANGFVEINNMLTAPNVASALKHPTYGYVATMGTNPRENTVITFKTKNSWNLDGYTHIMFAVKNPREEKLSVYLYENGGRVKTLTADIAKTENYVEYTTVIVSVEDFMKYDISFGYDAIPQATGSIWLTQLIAISVEDSQLDSINELNGMLEELSGGVTLESHTLLQSARALYESMSPEQKSFVKNLSVLIAAEEKYQALLVEDKIANIGSVSATEECLQTIFNARSAYDALSDAQKAMVSNYETLTAAETAIRAMATPDATAQAVIEEIQAFLNDFSGATPKNFVSVQAQIKAIDESVQGLTAMQQYSLTNYEEYLAAKNSFKVIDDLTGTDIASRFKYNGSTGINNGETAPNVADILNDPVYGPVATIGKANGGLDLKYIATGGLNLDGYTHVIFAMRNRMSVSISIQNSTTGAYYKDNVAVDEWVIVAMTTKEFLENGVSVWVSGSGSIWISPIIAVTMDNSYDEIVAEYNALVEEILTGEVTAETVAKIDEAKAIYNQLPEMGKLWAKDISVLTNVENVLQVINVINAIGEVQATIESIEKVQAARTAYDALNDEQKAMVSNYETLTEAEELTRAMTEPDATAQAVIEEIQAFLNSFSGVTPQNFVSVQAQIKAIDESVQGLTAMQQYSLTNYEEYLAAKNSFKVIDDMTGLDIASRFNLNAGANGINNGETAPGVAATLNDGTYGPCATIGKSAAGLEISYAATEGLDLSDYNYVLIAVKNNLGASITVKDRKTGAALSSEIASGTFGIVKMTVDQFLNSGMAIWVGNQGSVWISTIICVK